VPSTTPTSGEPEVPPDIPPEYVDAYLAGFRRAYDGELTQVAAEPVDETPEPVTVARVPEAPRGVDERDRPEKRDRPDKRDRPQQAHEASADDTVREARREPDLEWLFERDRDAPLGWAFDPTEEPDDEPADEPRPAPSRPRTGQRAPRGRRPPGVTRAGPAGPRGWCSPCASPFLLVLMLVSYIGGMAFSTVVNR